MGGSAPSMPEADGIDASSLSRYASPDEVSESYSKLDFVLGRLLFRPADESGVGGSSLLPRSTLESMRGRPSPVESMRGRAASKESWLVNAPGSWAKPGSCSNGVRPDDEDTKGKEDEV